jgi:hypothetical protein
MGGGRLGGSHNATPIPLSTRGFRGPGSCGLDPLEDSCYLWFAPKILPLPIQPERGMGHHRQMDQTWTIAELHEELERFERAARAAGLADNSVRTYVDRSRYFVRWLAGDFHFQGPKT